MHNFTIWLENINKKFYHGSSKKLEVGTMLIPQEYDKNWGDNQWARFLDHYKPPGKLARNKAVYMFDNLDDFDSGLGSDGYIYLVKPMGVVSKHDANWISEIESMLSDDIDDEEKYKKAALNYWNSIPHYNESIWEYMTPTAMVLELIEQN